MIHDRHGLQSHGQNSGVSGALGLKSLILKIQEVQFYLKSLLPRTLRADNSSQYVNE